MPLISILTILHGQRSSKECEEGHSLQHDKEEAVHPLQCYICGETWKSTSEAPPPPPPTGFKAQIKSELHPEDWDTVCDHFSSLIMRGPVRVGPPVPPQLERLFTSLEDMPSCVNLFTNGAGKSLMYELLMLPHTRGNRYHVRTSTTLHPYNDWCGPTYRGGRHFGLQWEAATGGWGGEGALGLSRWLLSMCERDPGPKGETQNLASW